MSNLSRQEKELLSRYRKYRKRKRVVISICAVILLIGGSAGYYAVKNDIFTSQKEKAVVKKEDKKKADSIVPVLTLTQDELVIEQGTAIDYTSYIKEAIDDVDGNLIDKVVITNKVDTNTIGKTSVLYTAKDKAGNKATAKLLVEVVAPKKEEPIVAPAQNNTSSSTSNTPDQSVTHQQPVLPPLPTQYFLFSSGEYDMSNVATACASALKSSGRSGVCSPIQDENGIYQGMRLDFE